MHILQSDKGYLIHNLHTLAIAATQKLYKIFTLKPAHTCKPVPRRATPCQHMRLKILRAMALSLGYLQRVVFTLIAVFS